MAKAKTPAAPKRRRLSPPPRGPRRRPCWSGPSGGTRAARSSSTPSWTTPSGARGSSSSSATCRCTRSAAIVEAAAGENLVVQEAIHRRLADLRAELAGPDPTPIERLLAERAAYCWLVVWRYEEHLASAKDLTVKQAEFHQRRIDAAHRRFLSSLRTLAAVRKLALPAVQVNIGQNQVNVAGET